MIPHHLTASKRFEKLPDDNDFTPYHRAVAFARGLGLVEGSMQRGAPTALFLGAEYVSKWRGLDIAERSTCDGVIVEGENGFRGSVTLHLRPELMLSPPGQGQHEPGGVVPKGSEPTATQESTAGPSGAGETAGCRRPVTEPRQGGGFPGEVE